MKEIILCGFLILVLLISGCQFGNNLTYDGPSSKELICSRDSDCVIKEDNANCPIAVHKDDSTEVIGPPSLRFCQDKDSVTAICSNGECQLKEK